MNKLRYIPTFKDVPIQSASDGIKKPKENIYLHTYFLQVHVLVMIENMYGM